MRTETTLPAPNSVILIVSDIAADIPSSLNVNGSIGSTKTCVAVGTVAEGDGSVHVVLTDSKVDDGHLALAIETVLDSESGFIAIETVLGARLLTSSVSDGSQLVRVWVSDPDEPDQVVVEIVRAS